MRYTKLTINKAQYKFKVILKAKLYRVKIKN